MVRVAFWDLETTNLLGDVGRLLIGSIMTHDGKMITFRQDRMRPRKDFADDRILALKIRDLLEEHDLLVSWYGKGFDHPFLNTRLIQNGERRMESKLCLDGRWYMAGWRGLKPRNAKLSTAAEFFGLDEGKMDVPVEVWAKAATGNKAALDILAERCESDVRILKSITERILRAGVVKNIGVYP